MLRRFETSEMNVVFQGLKREFEAVSRLHALPDPETDGSQEIGDAALQTTLVP